MMKNPITIILLLTWCIGTSYAQININFEQPNDFSVCDEARFFVTIENSFDSPLEDVEVTLQVPVDCGISYQLASVETATELNISNLTRPVFSLPNIAPTQSHTFSIDLQAACAVADCINTGQTFNNIIFVVSNLGSNVITTTPYDIETPLLVITDISEVLMTGSKGDVLQRNITIQNTRQGALSSFQLMDTHQDGIAINFNAGNPQGMGDMIAATELTGANFVQIGDGDALFEFEETITIQEQILITACGIPQNSSASEIKVAWGCNDEICQSTSLNALVQFTLSDLSPALTFEPITRPPLCFCGGEGDTQGMMMSNNGTEEATEIILTIRQKITDALFDPSNGIDATSFVIDSSGIERSIEAQTLIPYAPEAAICDVPNSLFQTAFVRIPVLGVGESLSVFWDVYHCDPNCKQPFIEWEYDFGYYKSCPPNPYISGSQIYVSDRDVGLSATVSSPSATLENEENYTFSYQVNYENLDQTSGVFSVDILVPCGLVWEDDDMVLGGVHPSGLNVNELDFGTRILAEYDLPLPFTTASMDFDMQFLCENLCEEMEDCRDSLVTTCPVNCLPAEVPSLILGVTTSVNSCAPFPAQCGLQRCLNPELLYDCGMDSICLNFLEGYLDFDTKIYRTNLGLADNNNDRIADANGLINLDSIRRDRAMTGDTIEAKVAGLIKADILGASFKKGLIDLEFIAPETLGEENLQGLFVHDGLIPFHATLRVVDASTNNVYECDNLMPLPHAGSLYSYEVTPAELAAMSCAIPPDFEYAAGDSVILTAQYRVDYNMTKVNASDLFPPIASVSINPAPFFYNTPSLNKEETFICGCTSEQIEITAYEYKTFPGIYALPSCDTSDFTGAMLFKIEIGDGNFFPFEHRFLAELSDFEIEIPDFISMTEAKLTRFAMQASMEHNQEFFIKEEEPLPIDFNNGRYHFDFSTCQNPAIDEGFNFLLQYRFLTDDCKADENYSMHLFSTIEFSPNLPEAINPLADTLSSKAIRSLRPNLFMEVPIANISSLDDKARWDFNLINFPSNVTSSESGMAENAWMYPISNSGDVDNFELLNTETGELVPQINGVFQLGDIMTRDSLPYQLLADNHSCMEETVTVHYGWNCEPYTNPNFSSCYEKMVTLSVTSPPGEIELIVENPEAPNDLCDTVPYHTITIFNAQLGTVFDVLLEGQLPPGLNIVPNSTQISYPTGSDFITVADPTALGDGYYNWDISALNDTIALNGLASFSQAPAHSVTLRFQTMTSCDFIAGAYIDFLARAHQNCAIPTNFLSEAGHPIEITNVNRPYEASIHAEVAISACEDSTQLIVNMTMSGETDLRDSIFIALPPGVTYVPNSYAPISHAPSGEPQLQNGDISQLIKWILPSGVAAGQSISFEIGLTGLQNLDCGIAPIVIRTVAESQALCVVNGEDCSILVETGSTAIDAFITKPIFNINNFNVEISPSDNGNLVNYQIDIQNLGTVATGDSIILDFYIDQDGNGSFSMGDILVKSSTILEAIAPNEALTYAGSFEMISDDFCQLIAIIDPLKNCACETDETTVNLPIIFNLPTLENVCSNEDMAIGVANMSGHTYEWLPDDNLSCDDCAMPIFNFENTGEEVITLSYTLTDDDNTNCLIQYQLDINVLPELTILTENTTICEGQSINLVAATQAMNVLWQPGNFSEQIFTVTPTETTTYTATMVDEGSCVHSDEITVTVSPSPEINAGEDRVFCGEESPMLNATVFPDVQYQWSPAAVLSNPSIPNPLILTTESTLFTLTITDENGCQNTDQVQIDFGEMPDLVVNGERTVCLGNSTALEATGSDNYQWSPAEGLSCTDCPNPMASPETTTLYTLSSNGTNACTATLDVLITVTEGNVLITEEQSTCANEPIEIFGLMTAEAGNYFDTTEIAGGCLEIHRISLMVFDTTFEQVFIPAFCEGDSAVVDGQVFTEAGEFCFTFPSDAGCDSTVCYVVETLESLDIQFPADMDLFLGESVDLNIMINGDTTAYLFEWNPTTSLSCTDCSNPTATPTESTDYTITITDNNGCIFTETIKITVNLKCEIEEVQVPNVFTPNGDTTNDVFEIVRPTGGNEMVETMRIYNRWGQVVFEGSGEEATWDGTVDGKLAPSDVYIFYVVVACPDGEREIRGDVTLVR